MFPAQEMGLSISLTNYIAHGVCVYVSSPDNESVNLIDISMLYMATVSMFPAQEMGLSTRLTMKAYILHEVYVYISAKKMGLSTWLTKYIVHGVYVCLQLRE